MSITTDSRTMHSPLEAAAVSTAGARIRVAIALYRDNAIAGGSLRVGETLANYLEEANVEAHLIFAYGGPGPVTSRARAACHFLNADGRFDAGAWLRARGLMRKLQPDIVHFMEPVAWLRGALTGTEPMKLLHLHGRFKPSYMSRRGKLLTRSMLSAFDALVFISNEARLDTQRLGWGEAAAMHTVYNAIDCSLFDDLPSKRAARERLRLPQDARIAGMTCRLVRHRGCDDAIRILERLDRSWHLALVGDGPYRAELERLAGAARLQNRVHFTGLMDDVRPALAAFDAALFLARYEPFGLAICEAMAAGVPVFALSGENEFAEAEYPLITDDNAVCVPRNRPHEFEERESSETLDLIAGRIRDYGENPARHQRMVTEAYEWVRERFDAPVLAASMAGLYRSLLHEGARA